MKPAIKSPSGDFIMIRCTQKLFNLMGISPLADQSTHPSGLAEWYANIFTQSRRRGLIFTNAPTLYSFAEFDVPNAALQNLGSVFTNGLHTALTNEGFDNTVITQIVQSHQTIRYGQTTSRQILGNMNDLVHMYQVSIEYNGGLAHCNLANIIKTVNRTPQRNLEWKYSIDRLKELIQSSFDGIPS